MKLRSPLLTAMLALTAAAPANAATLTANKPCYREGDLRDPVIFGGGPFTPGGSVTVTRDGLPLQGSLAVNAAGLISPLGVATAPIIDPSKQRPFTLTATDQRNPALTGSVTRLATQLDVAVRPTGGRPAVRRRLAARGFTSGGTLYGHVVRGRGKRTVRIGTLSGACGTLTTRKRVFRKRTKNGVYRVQFDQSRGYAATTYPRVTFRVRIYTVFRRRASSAGAGERWARID